MPLKSLEPFQGLILKNKLRPKCWLNWKNFYNVLFEKIGQNAADLVDGFGAGRVAQKILDMVRT